MSRPLKAALTGAVGLMMALPGVAVASIQHPSVVSEDPANFTPNLVGSGTAVYGLHQLGGTMYAGGQFSTVENSARTTTYPRSNIMAFNATTGAMTSFAPNFNGAVWAIVSDGASMWVGGYFTSVNGVARRAVVKINPTTGAVDTAFNAGFGSGRVTDLRLVDGRLIVGGSIPGRLVALDPATGANTGYINIPITGTVSSQAGATDIYRFAVDPSATRLVAIGNFTTVGGTAKSRAFMLNLGATSATLNPWYYQPLTRMCRAASLPAYLRGVDFSPDGSYFVLAATGYIPAAPSGIGTDVCDAAARFETNVTNPTTPTWINYTGGDTLHSVAVTGAAVYIQGHQRWANNPQGNNSAGPGAVPRSGIAALNPTTGLALPWNPGKSRGVGGKVFLVTPAGLWVGSDGQRFSGEYRRGIAFCPLP